MTRGDADRGVHTEAPTPAPGAGARSASPRRAELLAAYTAVYVLWGSTFLAIRFGLETIPPFGLAGVRNLVAGLALYAWSCARGAARPTPRQWGAAAFVGALLLLAGNGAVSWAEQRVPSGVAALLAATEPLWIVLLAWWRPGGARPTAATALAVVLGLTGVAVLVGPGASHGAVAGGSASGAIDLGGAAAILAGAIAWAAGSLWSSRPVNRSRLPASTTLSTGMQMVAGGALLLAASAITGEAAAFRPAAVSGASLGALGYLVSFGSLVGFNAYAWLLSVEPPTRVATYAFVNPVIAVLLGWGIAGESLSGRVLVAAAVIVGAVALLTSQWTPPSDDATTSGSSAARHGAGALALTRAGRAGIRTS